MDLLPIFNTIIIGFLLWLHKEDIKKFKN